MEAEKAFYRGWAQLWAQHVTADEAQRRSLQDVRAPGPWRANVPLMQQAAYAAAFACKPGAPMQSPASQQVSIFD